MLSSLLRQRVDWDRPEIVLDDSLGSTRTFQLHQAGLRCLVQPIDAREQNLYAQRQVKVTHQIFFDRILDLQTGDRFRLIGRPGASPKIYVITGWADQGGQGGRCFCVNAYEFN